MTDSGKRAHVLLGVTGSIAAYKAAELVRLFGARGWDVTVVMTRNAAEFVSPLTFRTLSRNPVHLDTFPEEVAWRPEHVAVAEWADVMVVAPCSANVLAKLAGGIADDLLSSTALACAAPLVIAPAMNESMWDHPATRENVQKLRSRGVTFIDVEAGELASGAVGRGRMADVETIVAATGRKLGTEE